MFRALSSRTLAFTALLCVCLAPSACGSDTLIVAEAPSNATTYLQQASLAAQTLQTWYDSSTGLYASPSGWWNSANAITALINFEHVAQDATYFSVIANTFAKAQTGSSGHMNFINNFYDDMGWWALAWIDAYDLTNKPAYLSAAESIFFAMTSGWDTTTCGGGIWWTTSHTYKNAIANELFLDVAAKLANRTSGSTSAMYLTWAQKEWSWFLTSGMINSAGLINDGLTSTNPAACKNNNATVWTYNQGVILGGLVELSQATSDPTLLTRAQQFASAVLSPASGLVNSSGILIEPKISGGDLPQFKGIFLRNLMELYAAAPTPQLRSFADANADSLWTNDRNASNQLGALWQGPVDSTDATRQSSALDALTAAAAMK
jgi:predicted alpha-1,6-mannanase (GH76 family)